MEESIAVRQDVDVSEKSSTHSAVQKLKKLVRKNRLFVGTVVVPTLISIIYYGFIASDIYISESQFLVRSSKQSAPTGLGMILGPTFSNALNDNHSVNAYILSRDALKNLDSELAVRDIYSRDSIDFISRFGLMRWKQNFEGLYEYYHRHVSIYLDNVSAISTLKVSAYKPEDAQKINEVLLLDAEKHVNKLNERARLDAIRFAKQDLDIAQKSAQDASEALTEYRNKKGIIFDPAYFEQLVAEKAITLEQLKNRHAAYISASDEARRQFLYLERLAEPHLPDYPLEPRRIRTILATFILGLIIWGVLSMLAAGVREHHD